MEDPRPVPQLMGYLTVIVYSQKKWQGLTRPAGPWHFLGARVIKDRQSLYQKFGIM